MSTIDLGKIKLVWRGPYDNSTAYTPDDVVSSGGASYICIANSTGNAVSSGSHWQQMSAAGTNGTDLTSTLGTQGQIVYRDGSGLAALNPGTSGQYLETKGAGQNPVWSSVSAGELQFISTHSLTGSNVGSWSFDNVLDNTNYDHYKINIYNLSHNNSTNTDTWFALRASGSNVSANIYAGRIRNNPSSNGFTTETTTNNYMRFEHSGTSGTNGESTGNYEVILYNASCKRSDGTANTHRPMANCRFVCDFNDSTQVQQGFAVGIWNTTTPVDGFLLNRTGYDILGSTIKPKVDIYGYVKQ